MSHTYLLATHNFLEQQLAIVTAAYERAEDGTEDKLFAEGRLAALKEFREYLSKTVDPKLPKRLYKQLKSSLT
jgi:hypothetical protein